MAVVGNDGEIVRKLDGNENLHLIVRAIDHLNILGVDFFILNNDAVDFRQQVVVILNGQRRTGVGHVSCGGSIDNGDNVALVQVEALSRKRQCGYQCE